jgi:hypothetical protein
MPRVADQTWQRRVAPGGLAVFLVSATALHLLERDLEPGRQVISEYANTPVGWLAVVGLLSWAVSLAATASEMERPGGKAATRPLVAALLVVAAVGLVVAAVFPTQAVAGTVPAGVDVSRSHRLHDFGSGVATGALFAAAATVAARERWGSQLGRTSLLVLALAIVVQTSLLFVGPEVAGLRQRLLVLAACTWHASLMTARPGR